jgi:mannosyl-inositol-phosphoceramide inositolphosphotransferase
LITNIPRNCADAAKSFVRRCWLVLLNEKTFLQLVATFFLNFIPVLIWLFMFKNAKHIPTELRPRIFVKLMPAWDEALYETPQGFLAQSLVLIFLYYLVCRSPWALLAGLIPFIMNLLFAFAQTLSWYKDVMSWLSYGVFHFISPYMTAVWLWSFAPPGIIGVYARAFGCQNIAGVITHLSFPNAAPWYQSNEYGFGFPPPPGNYSMPGSAAGLVRIDKVLGTHLYKNVFRASPLVFGAFPSLHSGFAVLNFYFLARYSPRRGKYLLGFFVFWQWWATMYLQHHWRVDLIGGALYSTAAFLVFLPAMKRFDVKARRGNGWNGWERFWHFSEWIERKHYQRARAVEEGDEMEDTDGAADRGESPYRSSGSRSSSP